MHIQMDGKADPYIAPCQRQVRQKRFFYFTFEQILVKKKGNNYTPYTSKRRYPYTFRDNLTYKQYFSQKQLQVTFLTSKYKLVVPLNVTRGYIFMLQKLGVMLQEVVVKTEAVWSFKN